jgi:sterol 24-C-methyltransferase
MVKISEGLRAIKAAGFELEFHEDLSQRGDEIPWWYPLAGEMKYCRSVGDLFTVLRMTKFGRGAVHKLVGALEMVGVAPQGTQKTADTLAVAADCLVAGAKVCRARIFRLRYCPDLKPVLTRDPRKTSSRRCT